MNAEVCEVLWTLLDVVLTGTDGQTVGTRCGHDAAQLRPFNDKLHQYINDVAQHNAKFIHLVTYFTSALWSKLTSCKLQHISSVLNAL